MPNLELIASFERKLQYKSYDTVFESKKDAVKFSKQFVAKFTELRRQPRHLHWWMEYLFKCHHFQAFINNCTRYGWQLLLLKQFDVYVFNELFTSATDEREGYAQVQFTPELLQHITESPMGQGVLRIPRPNIWGIQQPRLITPPLTIDNNKITSLLTKRFYARIEDDVFDTPTLVVRSDGQEMYCKVDDRNVPFLSDWQQDDVQFFVDNNIAFEKAWLQLKGMIRMRTGKLIRF